MSSYPISSEPEPAAADADKIAAATPGATKVIPLFVDLDGTLIATDMGQETAFQAIKQHPAVLLQFPLLAARGLAVLKRHLASRVRFDAAELPYHARVVTALQEAKAAGRPIILATASDRLLAEQIAAHLGLFDAVLASDGLHNLKGSAKLAAIQEFCAKQGWEQFEYWGDARVDLPIWRAENSAAIGAVNPGRTVRAELQKERRPVQIWHTLPPRWRALLKLIRPTQWVKNLLLFVPLVLGHQLSSGEKIWQACVAFMAFSLCASAVYVLNDLFDAPADRRNPHKCRRPFAAGTLPLAWGPFLSLGLAAAGFAIALLGLPWAGGNAPSFALLMGAYGLINLAYSLWLKRHMVIDVLLLAGMYCLRIVLGGVATGITVSEWLMAFAIFFFTSLAFAKRHAELARLADENQPATPGRGYGVHDLSMIESIGPTAGYMSILVLALYVNSDNMKKLYNNHWALLMICPVMLYWMTRLWFVAKRRELNEDPLVYALSDWVSWLAAGMVVALAVLAKTGWFWGGMIP
ncbi:MAG: UbiA family prenyltransferase [Pirellulales bacterium]|nr:UbiA family prenyltransferase [Pirellulales bacterium]